MDPYRPPQEVDPFEHDAELQMSGGFVLPPEVQTLSKKLAKYLSEIGLLMIVGSVFSLLGFIFLTLSPVNQAGGAVAMGGSIVVNMINQLINVVLLFLIGRYMRSASKSFRTLSETTARHNVTVMEAMRRLKSLYTVECVYIGLGILMLLLNQAILFAF